jgi:hypothetical protein
MTAVLWLAGRALAQDTAPEPVPAEPPPPDPAPVEVPAPPVEVEPAPPVALDLTPAPVAADAPAPDALVDPRARVQRFEVDLELGGIHEGDVAYDLFSERDVLGDWGVRVGWRPASRLQVRAGWHLARHGADVSVSVPETDADFTSSSQDFRAAFVANEATLGLRADVSVQDLFFPYLAVDGMLFAAKVRLDDVLDDPENPSQFESFALTGGGLALAGFELRTPSQGPVSFGWHLEMGYGWLAPAVFPDVGTLQPRGYTVRSGGGVRF